MDCWIVLVSYVVEAYWTGGWLECLWTWIGRFALAAASYFVVLVP